MELSKSEFLTGLQCPKALWLSRHRPELAAARDAALELIVEQGREVGVLARALYPKGVLIEPRGREPALEATIAAIKSGAAALFEPAFRAGGAFVRADLLVKAPGGRYDLLEVKSGTGPDEELHALDLAVQAHAIEASGLKLRSSLLLHVDSEYARKGAVDPKGFFKRVDFTARVRETRRALGADIERLSRVVEAGEPKIEVGRHCERPHSCGFRSSCWANIPEYSVYDIARLSDDKLAKLRAKGVLELKAVPDDFKLSAAQRLQVELEKSQRPRVARAAIAHLLSELREPLYFLDFETIALAIPPYEGMSPYGLLPFQFSLRVGDRHVEFLADGKSDPRPAVADALAEAVEDAGTVIAYNKSFEARCLTALSLACPRRAPALLSMRERLWDLAEPFKTGLYADPAFRGSWSIKAVLPALLPGLGYEGLAIAEGGAAQAAYRRLMLGLPPAEAATVRAGLLEYCGHDTRAMVELLGALRRACA